MMNNENKALLYAEQYGIVNYNIKTSNMIYYINYPMEHNTYKCIVDLKTMQEKRICLKRYYKNILN